MPVIRNPSVRWFVQNKSIVPAVTPNLFHGRRTGSAVRYQLVVGATIGNVSRIRTETVDADRWNSVEVDDVFETRSYRQPAVWHRNFLILITGVTVVAQVAAGVLWVNFAPPVAFLLPVSVTVFSAASMFFEPWLAGSARASLVWVNGASKAGQLRVSRITRRSTFLAYAGSFFVPWVVMSLLHFV